ncbi:MAG TPA: NAD(P)H-dependent oxidoreductase subunit E [Vicinamibacterales bacterium]|nr:NAD(P)H-dependent oxidoreductase subunit E [Vicinamibacterales bacterium]
MREQTDRAGASPVVEAGGFYGSSEPVVPGEVEIEAVRVMDSFLADQAGGTERLIPLLHRIQEEIGYLPIPVQERVAARLGLSPIQVFSVVSFYSFFTLTPRGRFPLKVCMGTACFVRHASGLLETLEDLLQVKVGGCTPDGMFSLEQVRCLGACGLAPAMMVGNEVHGNLDPKQVRRLLTRLRAEGRREAAARGEAAHV